MKKGYWIGKVEVLDPAAFAEYGRIARQAVKKYGGRYLVRAGAFKAASGDWGQRQVVVEFDSYERALACYESPEYQGVLPIRAKGAIVDSLIIEGIGDENENIMEAPTSQ